MDIKINCLFDKLVNPKDLKDHPKNRNKHGSDQIERLAELYKYQGVRHPIIVSKQSGFIVAGHGRKLAAIRAGVKQMPVVYQDFDNSEQEYAFIQSDNAIALWADLDIENIELDIKEFSDDFDRSMLAIKKSIDDIGEISEEVIDIDAHESKDKFEFKIKCESSQEYSTICEYFETVNPSISFKAFAKKIGLT